MLKSLLRMALGLGLALAGIAGILLVAGRRFDRLVDTDRRRLLSRPRGARAPIVTQEMLADLPEPAQRYLRYAGIVGRPMVDIVRLRQACRMRPAPNGISFPIAAEQWYRVEPPGFIWDATVAQPDLGTDLNLYCNKDALLFPEPVAGPDGEPAFAMLHRPMWDLSLAKPGEDEQVPRGISNPRPGIWVSFAPVASVEADIGALIHLEQHRLVALPEQSWESLKIGAGTPPVRIPEGWLVLYHGVSGTMSRDLEPQKDTRYSAGAMILDADDVTRVIARTRDPLLGPKIPSERHGIVPNVVFPTAIEPLEGSDSEHLVFYGMADSRIGAARLRRARPPS